MDMNELETRIQQCDKVIFPPGKQFSSLDYLHAYGSCLHAVAYSALFMPPLVEVGGSVLLAEAVSWEGAEDEYLQLKESGKVPLAELEEGYNLVEVGYLFGSPDYEEEEWHDEFLAVRLRDAWDGWLKVQYPDRKFHVQLNEPDEAMLTEVVTFHEIRQNFPKASQCTSSDGT